MFANRCYACNFNAKKKFTVFCLALFLLFNIEKLNNRCRNHLCSSMYLCGKVGMHRT